MQSSLNSETANTTHNCCKHWG